MLQRHLGRGRKHERLDGLLDGKQAGIGDRTFRWKKRDHFVAPSWATVVHQAADESVLFSFSDRPVQERLDLWREDRGGR